MLNNMSEKPNLCALRLNKGWSQQQTADHAGRSLSYYSMLETSNRVPSVVVAKKLAKVFQISWFVFFE